MRDMEYMLKKRVKIVEYSSDLTQFIKNVVSPLELREIRTEDARIFLDAKDLKTRGLLIGRSASNLRFFESIVKRYFPIEEMRVI